jgi:hypothetical protein
MAVVALGSTSCSIVCSSSLSVERLEFDLNLLAVFDVSVRCKGFAKREEMLPLCLTDDCSMLSKFLQDTLDKRKTYCLWSMQHPNTEIPQK